MGKGIAFSHLVEQWRCFSFGIAQLAIRGLVTFSVRKRKPPKPKTYRGQHSSAAHQMSGFRNLDVGSPQLTGAAEQVVTIHGWPGPKARGLSPGSVGADRAADCELGQHQRSRWAKSWQENVIEQVKNGVDVMRMPESLPRQPPGSSRRFGRGRYFGLAAANVDCSHPPPRALMSWTAALRRWPASRALSRSAWRASRLASTTSK